MKKRLISIIMCILLGVLLLGCSGGKDSDSEKEDSGEQESSKEQTIDKDFTLQMTDSYTFTDPQDIDFDESYVLVGDIVYVNEGTPAGEYQYFVSPDEASAAALAEFYISQGQQIIQEGNIIFSFVDGDTLEGSIVMMAGTGAISDETPEAYIEMMKSFNGVA